ncbi:aldehyde dehydrogenase (NADP(+)) [Sphingomonas naphthae]|uniref:Aldehyde dehydrogenase (NADP(+)) n=1 Tax=Sphingomonas naphthae TaxID=1813468 RepID=A0ABY7TNC9_9SPHN|nr:aldehyde dehydrogenase (NADP(+)) [Sphingomonas naphthae]WCT74737.1 aldehyde dehydrogenase (NADP(+)) [Sphingomonas naphthae]
MDGTMIIGGERLLGAQGSVQSVAAATGEPLEPAFGTASTDDVARACALAEEAFDSFRETTPTERAAFLDTIADEVLAIGDPLIERVMLESGLPRGRLEGERGRTMGQLRMFANVLREGSWRGVRIDPAQPDRAPAPRPDLRLRQIPVGPVAVFGASNFPLAFSVAGGDTASALAAGCPVVVKAHRAHLGTSALVAEAIERARVKCGLHPGVFSLIIGEGNSVGTALVADPNIKAVGFTGSRGGGTALMRTAAARPEPIPVYAEMSSINPVLLFPAALAERGEAIAKGFAASLTLGSGQFCTNPGLVMAIDSPALDAFLDAAEKALSVIPATTMLTPGIHSAYSEGVAKHGAAGARLVGQGLAPTGTYEGHAHIFETAAATFLSTPALHEEIFGPAALVVRCADVAEMKAVLAHIEGQLTIALHIADGDHAAARELLPLLERKAGRLLANGFGTGVEVGHAMVHGGPFPATSDPRTTSVGSLAIERFLRPVSYQDIPDDILPPDLQEANPLGLPRRIDGYMA